VAAILARTCTADQLGVVVLQDVGERQLVAFSRLSFELCLGAKLLHRLMLGAITEVRSMFGRTVGTLPNSAHRRLRSYQIRERWLVPPALGVWKYPCDQSFG
jgi:hypothetical protein